MREDSRSPLSHFFESLPACGEVRIRLEHNFREREFLKKVLKLAAEKERLRELEAAIHE